MHANWIVEIFRTLDDGTEECHTCFEGDKGFCSRQAYNFLERVAKDGEHWFLRWTRL